MQERLEALLAIFRATGPATQGELAIRSGVAASTLSTNTHLWRTATKRAVLLGSAELLRLDYRRLLGWQEGADDQELDELIARLGRVRKCTACGGLFEPEQINSSLCQCRPCQWSPSTREWVAAVDGSIDRAPGWVQEAWLQSKADLSLITLPGLAQLAGRELAEVEAIWTELDLPRRKAGGRPRKATMVFILAISAASSLAQADQSLLDAEQATRSENIHYRRKRC